MACETRLALVLVTLIALSQIDPIKERHSVILAHTHHDFRCSHVPPAPEQINHVWLDSGNFASDEPNQQHPPSVPKSDKAEILALGAGQVSPSGELAEQRIARSRRFIDVKNGQITSRVNAKATSPTEEKAPTSSAMDTLWDFFRQFERSTQSSSQPHTPKVTTPTQTPSPDDLVPMRIQVYYDASVNLLDKKRLKSIKELVMPTVVKFFEDVLLIRREYTIDRFRISRRCPNNTIYYVKDVVSRPYCMDRCEDHAVCGEMIVPKEHLSACSYCNTTSRRCTTNYSSEGRGAINTQLLLYVSAKQTARCKRDQTIAYAAHCAQDTKTDRPVAGHANLCPNSISTEPKDLKALIATVKHELTHVLGFSVSLFAYYRDSKGRPLTERDDTPGPLPVDPRTGYAKWSDKVIRRVIRSNWTTGDGPIDKEVHLMVTPTVIREVRKHFNCSTLEGAELEDQGSDGTSMTHWEKRLFENEAMTGTHTQNSVYSKITLAALQDTGWYVANFSAADRLDWGKDLGCDFARKSCKSWIDERRARQLSIRPFCDRVKGDVLQIACTEDRSSKAVCNMRHYKEPLPGIYQNFDYLEGAHNKELAHFGGSVDLADYCPFIQEFTWQVQNVTVRGSRCDHGANSVDSEKNAALEYYGPEARCFEHGRRWDQRSCIYRRQWGHFGAGCYKVSCAGNHINVIVGNRSYPCYYPDQVIHMEQLVDHWLYNGSLICPSCDKICSPNKCTNYDKRLIDQIIGLGKRNEISSNFSHTQELLRSMLDEYYNEVDTNSDASYKKSFVKYKSVLEEVSRMNRDQRQNADLIPYHLLTFQTDNRIENIHSLICSTASSNLRPAIELVFLGTLSALIILLSRALHQDTCNLYR